MLREPVLRELVASVWLIPSQQLLRSITDEVEKALDSIAGLQPSMPAVYAGAVLPPVAQNMQRIINEFNKELLARAARMPITGDSTGNEGGYP